MTVVSKKLYFETDTHFVEILYVKPSHYMLMIDGAFCSNHETKESAIKEANRTAEWFGLVDKR